MRWIRAHVDIQHTLKSTTVFSGCGTVPKEKRSSGWMDPWREVNDVLAPAQLPNPKIEQER